MESKSTDNTQMNSVSTKEAIKTKTKIDTSLVCNKQENDGTTDLLNPSVLDEVLAEKKMALMKSPDVMKFLQMHQARLAKQSRENVQDDDDKDL